MAEPLDTRKLSAAISNAAYRYIDACLGEGPSVLLAEDLQWFDGATLELLERIAGGNRACMIVMTARSGRRDHHRDGADRAAGVFRAGQRPARRCAVCRVLPHRGGPSLLGRPQRRSPALHRRTRRRGLARSVRPPVGALDTPIRCCSGHPLRSACRQAELPRGHRRHRLGRRRDRTRCRPSAAPISARTPRSRGHPTTRVTPRAGRPRGPRGAR